MKTIEFRGYSDDVFCFGNDETDDAANYTIRIAELRHKKDVLWVHGQYGEGMDAVWMIGLSVPDGADFPDWKLEWKNDGSSVVLSVTVPDETKITLVKD